MFLLHHSFFTRGITSTILRRFVLSSLSLDPQDRDPAKGLDLERALLEVPKFGGQNVKIMEAILAKVYSSL